jgi:glucose-6-phosphate isomerase
MKWEEVCQAFPYQWVLIEAIQANTNDESERILEEVAPLKKFSNSPEAMKAYQELHRENPSRELYVLHTSRKNPNIIEKKWVGVRR